jgi:phosphoenolpyruvate carboxykinase (GTP)
VPEVADLDTRGLDIKGAHVEELLSVDIDGWLAELPSIREHFAHFGSRLPEGLDAEVQALEERLRAARR